MGKPSQHMLYNDAFMQLVIAYRNYLFILGYTTHTIQAKFLYVKEFFCWVEAQGIQSIQDIRAAELTLFFEYMRHKQSSVTKQVLNPKTVFDKLRAVQAFFAYALQMGILKVNPASHLKINYPNQQLDRWIFSQEHIGQLYQKAAQLQEIAFLHIGYGCGVRVNEICLLNLEDIRIDQRLIVIQKGKNSKHRVIPINGSIAQELGLFMESIERKGTKQPLFVNGKGTRMQPWTLNKMLKKLIKRTGFGKHLTAQQLHKIGVHTLRHSIATHLLQNGMDVELVQQFLGHSLIESTQVYTHISQQQINALQP